jgi:hypothetical protein
MADAKLHKRFLLVLGTTFLLVSLCAAGFNYLVDPYGLFGSHRVAGFNALKPTASERVRVTKPYMATRAKPRVVVGGNSRPEMGLNPQSPCWKDADQPVFNTAIPGADVFMQVRYVQHAVESGKARRILFGVDFLDFLVDSKKTTGTLDWDRLGRRYAGRLRAESGTQSGLLSSYQQAEDMLGGLFSMVALGDSIVTLATQRDPHSATRREDGFNPALDYLPIIRNEGQAVLFTQKNAEVRKRLRQDDLGVLDANGRQSLPLLALRRLLHWAKSRDIEVVLFINPYHSDYLLQIETSGKWALLEEWKRQLTVAADEYAVALWDFNAFDPTSTEAPPLRGDRQGMLEWYWEPAHYRHELGDLMLAAMLDQTCGKASSPPRFGVRITQETLPAHLDKLRSDMRRFVDQNPRVLSRLAAGKS